MWSQKTSNFENFESEHVLGSAGREAPVQRPRAVGANGEKMQERSPQPHTQSEQGKRQPKNARRIQRQLNANYRLTKPGHRARSLSLRNWFPRSRKGRPSSRARNSSRNPKGELPRPWPGLLPPPLLRATQCGFTNLQTFSPSGRCSVSTRSTRRA